VGNLIEEGSSYGAEEDGRRLAGGNRDAVIMGWKRSGKREAERKG